MTTNKKSNRNSIAKITSGILALILAACSLSPAENTVTTETQPSLVPNTPTYMATTSQTPTVEPTATIEPSRTLVPTKSPEQVLAEFKESAEYKQGLQDYLNAMGLEAEAVTIQMVQKEINGQQIDFLEVEPNQDKLTPLQQKYRAIYNKLLLARKGESNNWELTNLRLFSEILDYELGSQLEWNIFSDSNLKELFFDQTNSVTIDYGVYWNNVHPKQGTYDFSIMDKQIEEVKKQGIDNIRGHALVFANAAWANPDWLTKGSISREELKQILIDHITNVVSYGKEQGIKEWVVVNEPYLQGYRENDFFYKELGYEYIEIAFQAARNADPNAILIYNDTDNHSSTGLTTNLTLKITESLKAKGLVDAVGVQGHLGDWVKVPNNSDVTKTLKNYSLPIIVTEFDFNITGVNKPRDEKYLYQAQVFRDFFQSVFATGKLQSFMFWGIDDKNSWIITALNNLTVIQHYLIKNFTQNLLIMLC
jgi:endo-1,4-beta-xylanase